ncbi:MAG: hypothetical protein ABJ251_06975 [Paracoccaceae bacterium]
MGKKLNPMAIKRAWVYDTDELAHALGVSSTCIRIWGTSRNFLMNRAYCLRFWSV